MLFKHKHLLEQLRANGCRATGEILSMKTVGGGSAVGAAWAPDQDLSSGWLDCWMQLRVIPEERGYPPFEATVMTRVHTLKYAGGSVPVWYDPRDPSKVVVDYEADLASEMHWLADAQRLAHRHDQRLGLAWTPLGGDLLPVEVLAVRGKGRIVVKGHLDELFRDYAPAVVNYVRSHLPELAPNVDPAWFARNDVHIDEPYGDLPHGLTRQDAASAGLAVAAALASLLSGRLVPAEVALTGALTDSGDLLPVSDFKGKAHCAGRCYAHFLVAPSANEHELYQVSYKDRRDLRLVFAATGAEALRAAFTEHPDQGHPDKGYPRLP